MINVYVMNAGKNIIFSEIILSTTVYCYKNEKKNLYDLKTAIKLKI